MLRYSPTAPTRDKWACSSGQFVRGLAKKKKNIHPTGREPARGKPAVFFIMSNRVLKNISNKYLISPKIFLEVVLNKAKQIKKKNMDNDNLTKKQYLLGQFKFCIF